MWHIMKKNRKYEMYDWPKIKNKKKKKSGVEHVRLKIQGIYSGTNFFNDLFTEWSMQV